MTWQEWVDGIVKIFNTPTIIAGVSVGMLIIWAIVVISKTSIGRKSLNKLRGLITDANDKMLTAKNELQETTESIKEYKELKEQEIKDIKEQYEVLLVGVKQEKDRLQDLVLAISENIHNKNVEKAVSDYVTNESTKATQEISEIVETEKEKARSEYEGEIADLRAEIQALKDLLNDAKNEAESDINEVVGGINGEE